MYKKSKVTVTNFYFSQLYKKFCPFSLFSLVKTLSYQFPFLAQEEIFVKSFAPSYVNNLKKNKKKPQKQNNPEAHLKSRDHEKAKVITKSSFSTQLKSVFDSLKLFITKVKFSINKLLKSLLYYSADSLNL